jgi:hypothetical protein
MQTQNNRFFSDNHDTDENVVGKALDGTVTRAGPNQNLLRLSPIIFRAVGTLGVGMLRHLLMDLKAEYGEKPKHVGILGIDTTHQPHLAGVEPLPSEWFFNLGGVDQIRDSLRRAREDRRIAAWMHEVVTRLAASLGAGGFPAAARFFYERSAPDVVRMMGSVLDPFTPKNRPATADEANGHSRLQAMNCVVTPTCPLRVIYVAGTTGGTVGALLYDVILFKAVMEQLHIEANLSLLLTLPAKDSTDDAESQRKLELTFGRLQELTDLDAGQVFSWPLGSQVLSARGPLFDTVSVLPEPTSSRLLEHQRFVGQLLLQWVSPLGMILDGKAVDMVHVYTTKGPHGQHKFLSLVGMATVDATPYADLTGYAEAALGSKATAARTISDGPAAVTRLIQRHGLTIENLTAPLSLNAMEIPPDMTSDPEPFLVYAEGVARTEAENKVQARARALKQQCRDALKESRDLLRTACLEAGPANAAQLARDLSQKLRNVEGKAVERRTQSAQTEPAAPSNDARVQLAARRRAQQVSALAGFLAQAVAYVEALTAELDRLTTKLQQVANTLNELSCSYEQRHEAFVLQRPPAHTLLNREAVDALVRRLEPTCMREIRALAGRVFDSDLELAQLKTKAEMVIAHHARPLERFRNFDEALRAAGERGRIVLENAAAAAEPSVRIDARWDRPRLVVRHGFVTVPEGHQAIEIVRRNRPHVFPAAIAPILSRIIIITCDHGIEPAAMIATRKAHEAHVKSTAETLPYADQRYEPLTDVMVPAPSEWFAYLAIPVHIHLGTGVIRKGVLGGYLYNGQTLGSNRPTAAEALLERTGRKLFLPSFEELCNETEKTLEQAGGDDGPKVVEILKQIEAKIALHMTKAGPAEKQVLMHERAAARAVRAYYEEQIQEHAAFDAAWKHTAPESSPSRLPDAFTSRIPPRIIPKEASHDGSPGHFTA